VSTPLLQGVALAGGVKKMLFDYALASKTYYLKDGFTQHKLWDKLVFGKVRSKACFHWFMNSVEHVPSEGWAPSSCMLCHAP